MKFVRHAARQGGVQHNEDRTTMTRGDEDENVNNVNQVKKP